MPHTIAIGSIFIECNHLGGVPADIETFRRSELFYGDEVLDRGSGTVGGMLRELRRRSADIRPLLVASGCPSGPVTSECYRELKSELLDRLSQINGVDGVLLALHGAAAVDDVGDLEGDLLAAVRQLVGPHVPIAATLDLHAHVTQQMVAAADALLAWETYPHKDALETGVRGATALIDILDGKLMPTMVMAKVPVIVSGVLGHTEGDGPFADVARFAKSHEGRDGVYSTSTFLVHPYLDVPDMGGGGLVITNNDMPRAEALAREIAARYWQRRFDLEPDLYAPTDSIARGKQIDGGPVLLVETADCCGGGAAGDSVATLKVLLTAAESLPSLVPVVDPAAAADCHRAGVGLEVTVELGHQVDSNWGQPVQVTGLVTKLSDGQFRYRGGIWDGQLGNMGPAAVLQVGAIQVCIASHATYEWFGEQFEAMGMNAGDAKFIVVKNPMNYGMAYADVSKAAFILDTPGPTPATLKNVAFRKLQRPYYPADSEIPSLMPTVLKRKR